MSNETVHARINEILAMLCELAMGNLDVRLPPPTAPPPGAEDVSTAIDGITVGLNMFAEELQATLIRKEQYEAILAELEQTQLQLLHSAKLASLGELAAGVAHELNQPLQIIGFAAEELRESLEDRGLRTLSRPLDVIDSQIHRGAGVIGRLLAFSRRDSDCALARADLNEVIEEAVAILGGQLATQDIEIRTELTPGLPPVAGRSNELLQVLTNLVINARDAVKSQPERRIELRSVADERYACLEVIDTGTGIADEDRPRVFDPFFTTKPMGKGTGLGLSISHSIVRRYGGSIEALSEGNRGTRMRVTLPIAGDDD
ncbi:MAG: ATP-binding protein [Myxococcota bacterium]